MLGKGTRIHSKKARLRREISWLFKNPEITSSLDFRAIEYPQIKSFWTKFLDIKVELREDLVRLETTAKDVIICSQNQRFLTKEGWKTAEELILDLKSRTILNRIKLCTVRGSFLMHPCLDSARDVGYGESYEIVSDSSYPLLAENFLIGVKNESK